MYTCCPWFDVDVDKLERHFTIDAKTVSAAHFSIDICRVRSAVDIAGWNVRVDIIGDLKHFISCGNQVEI